MRVAVIGAGGIGGLYGGLLARAGHEVGFLARGDHLRAIQTHGLEVRSADFGTFVVHATASDDASLLTFQNGLDAPDQVAHVVGQQPVLIGTTRLETTIVQPGVIGHLSPGHLVTVSAFDGPPTPQAERAAQTLRSAGIRTLVAPDGRRELWQKAVLL